MAARRPFDRRRPLGGRAPASAAEPPRDEQAEREEHRRRHQRAAEDVLGVDDAHHLLGDVGRLGVGAHHGVAQQDQDQRRRDHDAERAGDADQRRASPPPARRAPRAWARRCATAWRRWRRPSRSSAPAARPAPGWRAPARRRWAAERHAAAEQPVGQRQAVEQRAHEDVERQRLQQIGLQQADDAAGQRRQQADSRCRPPARRSWRTAPTRPSARQRPAARSPAA